MIRSITGKKCHILHPPPQLLSNTGKGMSYPLRPSTAKPKPKPNKDVAFQRLGLGEAPAGEPLTWLQHMEVWDEGLFYATYLFRVSLMSSLIALSADAPLDVAAIVFVLYLVLFGAILKRYKQLEKQGRLRRVGSILVLSFRVVYVLIDFALTVVVFTLRYASLSGSQAFEGNFNTLTAVSYVQLTENIYFIVETSLRIATHRDEAFLPKSVTGQP